MYMASPASVMSTARLLAGLSARQVALVAGTSPSTVSRIERSELDPTLSVFERALGACGYGYCKGGLVPRVDMSAVLAARRILDPGGGLEATDASDTWERRWARAGLLAGRSPAARALSVASLGARQASLLDREGAAGFRSADLKGVVSALVGSGRPWALTGGRAAALYTRVASVDWSVFYVEDVDIAARCAGLEPAKVAVEVTLIPFDDVTRQGLQYLEGGLCVVDYWQTVIDCLAGDGRMPAQAEALVARAFSPVGGT